MPRISLNIDGRRLDIDSRPSDAIALAVRTRVPVFVEDQVMDQAAISPEQDLESSGPAAEAPKAATEAPDAFKEFLEGLDLGGLE